MLKAFSRLCQGAFRPTDLFARYGGEEFVVMLPETGLEQAVGAAHKAGDKATAADLAERSRVLGAELKELEADDTAAEIRPIWIAFPRQTYARLIARPG